MGRKRQKMVENVKKWSNLPCLGSKTVNLGSKTVKKGQKMVILYLTIGYGGGAKNAKI